MIAVEDLVDRTPQWPQANFHLGLVYANLGELELAAEKFALAKSCDQSLTAIEIQSFSYLESLK